MDGSLHEATDNRCVFAQPFDIIIKSHETLHENQYGNSDSCILSLPIEDSFFSKIHSNINQIETAWLQQQNSCHIAITILEAIKYGEPIDLDLAIIDAIETATNAFKAPTQNHKMQKQLKIIREQNFDCLGKSINISHIAREIDIHPVHLARIYKQTFGLSMQDDRQLRRVKLGCGLLLRTQKTIAEIAHELNFFDQSHFLRVFRNFTQISPNDFRRKMGIIFN